MHRALSCLLGPAGPSFRALSGRLKFTVRRHKFNKDSLFSGGGSDAHLEACTTVRGVGVSLLLLLLLYYPRA